MNKKTIKKIIFEVVKDYFDTQGINDRINLNTPLFGRKSNLDSVGLVTVIVGIEENVEDEFGINIILADERAMSQQRSPFRTIGSLADYIVMLIEESTNE